MKRIMLMLAAMVVMALNAGAVEPEANKATDADVDPMLAAMAAQIVGNHLPGSLAGGIAATLRLPPTLSLKNDKDLGPFFESAVKHHDDYVVLVIPPKANHLFWAVFFNKLVQPTCYTSMSPTEGFTPLQLIENHREKVEQPLAAAKEVLYFIETALEADDGTPVPARQILSGGAK